MPRKYTLYFGEIRVGEVVGTDSNFPNLFGRIKYDESILKPQSKEAQRLADSLDNCRRSMRLGDVEHEQDVSKEIAAVNEETTSLYLDFIETDAWHLVDEEGIDYRILCPIVRDDDSIVWRWNPKGVFGPRVIDSQAEGQG